MTQTLGQQLKQIRESRDISLEEIAQKTHIRITYLKALEQGDVDSLPSPMQMRGFLRLYASEMGVEIEDLQVKGYHLFEESQSETEPTTSEREPELPPEETVEPTLQPDPIETSPVQSGLVRPESAPDTRIDDQPDQRSASEIFAEIGNQVKERRELLSLSLDDIVSHIHVRQHYLESVESGHFEALPSPVQAKGMLANYAEFLNLDVESLLLNYADGLQKQRLEKQTQAKQTRSAKELSPTALRLKNFFSLDLLVIAALFIAFATFVIWGVNRILAANAPITATTEIPEVADVLLATGSPTPQQTTTPDGTPSTQDAEGTLPVDENPLFTPAANNNPINVVVIPSQRTWVSVTSDSELVFEGRLLPGNAYDFSGEEILEILTGNAGALQVYFNDQDIGSAGLIGQVANLVFTEAGLILPTPTMTPAITETPQATPTPSITPTPSPTLPEPDDQTS